MEEQQIPEFAYQYFPTGRRYVGQPRNRQTGQKLWRRNKLNGLYFVPADDGDGGDKKQTYNISSNE
jgi:hypothetical protein